jgi:hypothetical protein
MRPKRSNKESNKLKWSKRLKGMDTKTTNHTSGKPLSQMFDVKNKVEVGNVAEK